jgi:hypothetical protein
VLPSKATRAAARRTANGSQKYAHTGKRRYLSATTIRPISQVSRFEPQFESLGYVAARVLRQLERARR